MSSFIVDVMIVVCHKKIKPPEALQSPNLRAAARTSYKKVGFRIKHPSCVLLKDDGMILANFTSSIVLPKLLEP